MTDREATSDGGGVQTLTALIRARMDSEGWSYADLAHRSNDDLTRGRWQQLGSGARLKAFPEPATIRLMARALGVEETSVVLSAAKSLGLDVRRNGPDLAQLMPAGTDQLPLDVRDAILSVIRATVTQALARHSDEESSATVQSGPSVLEWDKTGRPGSRTGQNPAQGTQRPRANGR